MVPKETPSLQDQQLAKVNYEKKRKNRNFLIGSLVALEMQKGGQIGVDEKGFSIKSMFKYVVNKTV